eukprot:m.178558 g.178558  ORF g.178558 m.178558 type:complete len:342 (+) comp14639_c0_seq36:156-1181(+)
MAERDASVSPTPQSRQEQVLQEPYKYITQVPGKDIRSKLIMAFDAWLQVPEDKLTVIKAVTKILHNASLLIDDIEDNSKLRRGIPVAHQVYGVAQTINCANYMYFKCMAKVMELDSPRAAQAFTDQLLELHRGQGMDIYWRDAQVCPTEDEYKEMVLRKTGGLFELAVQLMQTFSEDKRDYGPLLEVFGLYFQIRDDYANLQSKEYADNKSFCEDITEGKFSFPIIHSIRSTPHDRQLLNILKQRTEDIDLKKHCLECMRKTGSFEYTIGVLNELETQARARIQDLGGNPILTKILDALCVLHHPELETKEAVPVVVAAVSDDDEAGALTAAVIAAVPQEQ